jgi:hypothetical protein
MYKVNALARTRFCESVRMQVCTRARTTQHRVAVRATTRRSIWALFTLYRRTFPGCIHTQVVRAHNLGCAFHFAIHVFICVAHTPHWFQYDYNWNQKTYAHSNRPADMDVCHTNLGCTHRGEYTPVGKHGILKQYEFVDAHTRCAHALRIAERTHPIGFGIIWPFHIRSPARVRRPNRPCPPKPEWMFTRTSRPTVIRARIGSIRCVRTRARTHVCRHSMSARQTLNRTCHTYGTLPNCAMKQN